MSNMVDRACTAVMAVVAHCLAVGGMLATALKWASAFAMRRGGSGGSNSVRGLPLVWQQLLDPAVQLRRQPGQHVLELGPRLVPIELGRLQQAHHHRSALTRQLAADEKPIAPAQSPGPNSVLEVVVVDRHLTVQQVSPEPKELHWQRHTLAGEACAHRRHVCGTGCSLV